MPIQNKFTKMKASTFRPDYGQSLGKQVFPENSFALNGAGIITILRVSNSNKCLVLASRKLNPATNCFENCLALGGGFQYLKDGINSTFAVAINAAISFKAPGYPPLEENDSTLASIGLVSFSEQWNMQYATLHRFIDVASIKNAKALVTSINQMNKDWNKADRFGLYYLDDLLRIAKLTWNLEENHEVKENKIQEEDIVIKDLATGKIYEKFVIFDDLATAALNKFILNRELTPLKTVVAQVKFKLDDEESELTNNVFN